MLKGNFQKKNGQKKLLGFANSRWEMLLKAIDSRWPLLKWCSEATGKCPCYWVASGQFSKAVGKPMGTAQNNTHWSIDKKTELPRGYRQKHDFHPFSLKLCVSVYIC
jgi:hypothetical protein